MSEIDKIKRYINKYGAPKNPHYDANLKELCALSIAHETIAADAVFLAIEYGRAKGYQQALAERKAERKAVRG